MESLPQSDGTVVLFSTDTARWTEDFRYVRAVRPDAQGQWQIKGAPPGGYFVVALDAVEDGRWFEPEFLGAVRDHAARLTMNERQSLPARLRLATVERRERSL